MESRTAQLARIAESALLGTLALEGVRRYTYAIEQNASPPKLTREQRHSLAVLEDFLESARRGELPLDEMQKEHKAKVELWEAGVATGMTSLDDDVEAAKLVARLLPPDARVRDWIERVKPVVSGLRKAEWEAVNTSASEVEQLQTFLVQLAQLDDRAYYDEPGEQGTHVLRV